MPMDVQEMDEAYVMPQTNRFKVPTFQEKKSDSFILFLF